MLKIFSSEADGPQHSVCLPLLAPVSWTTCCYPVLQTSQTLAAIIQPPLNLRCPGAHTCLSHSGTEGLFDQHNNYSIHKTCYLQKPRDQLYLERLNHLSQQPSPTVPPLPHPDRESQTRLIELHCR